MGCPSEASLGGPLTFSICTHDPDTGVLTDADALPAYRLYEELTAVPILTGTMSKLDDAGTTGFYVEQIDCTVANGFEVGKGYTIYIVATVNLDTGGIPYSFRVVQDPSLVPWAVEFTYTITNSVTLLPISGVEVWVSTDIGGANHVWVGTTDAFGVARDLFGDLPELDPGTYYFWRRKAGYYFDEPDTEVVS